MDLVTNHEHELARHVFDAVELFMFSAVSWHPHRIHFDQYYATEVESHPTILVHGPLQAIHLTQELVKQLPAGSSLTSVTYRHTVPLYVREPSVMRALVTEVDDDSATVRIEMWMEKESTAERTTSGDVVVQLPTPAVR